MNDMKIRRLDLTALLVFVALMRHGKATAAAAELGLTGSAVSHTLGRLRDIFGDPLFLRRPHGLDPTAFARAIEPDIRRAIEAVQAAVAGAPAFDPAAASGLLRLSARDREIASHLPGVLSRLIAEAPGLRVVVLALAPPDSLRALGDGTLDLAVGYFPAPGPDIDTVPLRSECYLVAARADHPILHGPLTPERYAAAEHLLVATDGSTRGIVDAALGAAGLHRRVSLSLPHFLPALEVLARSDLVATLPASLVRAQAARHGLGHREPPVPIRPFQVSVLRHRRNLRNPLISWCLGRILA